MIKNRLVLIDAFALIHRAYHALPPLTSKDGKQVNAVYGFTSALLSAIKELEPEYLAVGFDLPGPTKRHLAFKDYKAHRPATPEELKSQIPYVKEILKALNIPIVAAEGYEGEDVIATIVAKCKMQNAKCKIMECIIVTGDMDVLQLVDEKTKVYSMARGVNQAVIYDEEKVKERYGLKPSQLVDYKALRGDPSDNIPGVKGIGEKTASSLIKQFGTLEKLYQAISNYQFFRQRRIRLGRTISNQIANSKSQISKKIPKNPNISEKILRVLLENKEQAFLSQKLAKIAKYAPLEFDLATARLHDFDEQKVIELFEIFGFKSLISRLPKAEKAENQPKLL